MFGLTLLDLILGLWLLGQLIYGFRAGLVVSLAGIAGFAAGAVAAFYAVPYASAHTPSPQWRTPVVIGVTIVLILLGHGIGIRLGAVLGRHLRRGPLGLLNRLLGAALNLAVGAVVIFLLAFGVSNLGIPVVSKQLTDSAVIGAIDHWTPDPVKSAAAQLRSLVFDEGIPQLLNPSGPNVQVAPPNASTDTPAWNNAAGSVLKISGTAFQCGQNQTGSGFVAAPERVVTNAHVVAGVATPVVQTRDQGSLRASVVYFDPVKDLAVLAVDGLQTPALPTGHQLPAGSSAAFAGYPLGGPLQVRPATVRASGPLVVPNIYETGSSALDVYQLAGNIQPGNSGGPLLDGSGAVVGVVFAKSTTSSPVGFAFTLREVGPVVAAAPMLSSEVSSGNCIRK